MSCKKLWCVAFCALTLALVPSVAYAADETLVEEQQALAAGSEAVQDESGLVADGAQGVTEPQANEPLGVPAPEEVTVTETQEPPAVGDTQGTVVVEGDDADQEPQTEEGEASDEDVEMATAVQPVIKDGGVYTITANNAKDVKVGVASGSTGVTLVKNASYEGEYWKATASAEEDAYYLTNYNGNLSLAYVSAESGGSVEVVSGTGSLWVFTQDADGSVKISPFGYENLALDVMGGKSSVGTSLHLYRSNNSAAQRFTFTLCDTLTEALKTGKTAVPGVVSIQSAVDNKKVLDIKGGSKSNAANVQVYNSNDSFAQKFEMRYRGNGLYYFVSINSGKVLDVASGSTAAGANVQQYGFNATLAQFWYLVADGDGYRIVNAKSGNVLSIAVATPANGSNVQVNKVDGSNSQRFFIKEVNVLTDGAVYALSSNCAPNNVLALSENGTANNTAVVTSASHEEVSGYWVVSLDSEGRATFTNVLSGYKLTAEDPTAKSAAKVSDAGIKWIVVPNGDGSFTLRPATNENLVLDIASASSAAGAKAQLWTSNKSKAQCFTLAYNTTLMNAVKNGKTASDGVVSIAVSKESKQVLDVAGGSIEEGANIQLYGSNNTVAQKYQLTYRGNGLYTVKNLKSGLYLAVEGHATESGSNVWLENYQPVLAQSWYLVASGDGYVFRNAASGLVLDATSGKTANKTNIRVYNANGTAAQCYLVKEAQALENGTYTFGTGIFSVGYYAIDVKSGSIESGANVQLYKGNGTDAQKWTVIYVGEGAYKLMSFKSGLLLSVEDGSTANDANICQLEDTGSTSQLWIIEYEVGGGYRFKNVASGKYLDVKGGKAESGSNIQQHNGNGTVAQLWFIKTDRDLLPEGALGEFIRLMIYYCDEVSVGYDQSNRWDIRDGGECDCSSLVIRCLEEAGFGAESAGATYTGNMRSVLTSLGWEVLPWDIDSVQAGDILLNDTYHTCVVVSGSGRTAKIAQASIDENGNATGGKGGDQNGKETNIKTVYTYSYGWDCILRYVG